jgi:hypothetical protein
MFLLSVNEVNIKVSTDFILFILFRVVVVVVVNIYYIKNDNYFFYKKVSFTNLE